MLPYNKIPFNSQNHYITTNSQCLYFNINVLFILPYVWANMFGINTVFKQAVIHIRKIGRSHIVIYQQKERFYKSSFIFSTKVLLLNCSLILKNRNFKTSKKKPCLVSPTNYNSLMHSEVLKTIYKNVSALLCMIVLGKYVSNWSYTGRSSWKKWIHLLPNGNVIMICSYHQGLKLTEI